MSYSQSELKWMLIGAALGGLIGIVASLKASLALAAVGALLGLTFGSAVDPDR